MSDQGGSSSAGTSSSRSSHSGDESEPHNPPKIAGMPGIVDGDKYFAFKGMVGDKGNFKAKCLHCDHEYSAALRMGGNLRKHLQTKHPEVHAQFLQENPSRGPKNQRYNPAEEATQAGVKRKICDMIVAGGLPLSLVEMEEFKVLMEYISEGKFHSIERKTLVQELVRKYEEHILFVTDELGKVRWCCTTADIWSAKRRSFLGMTVHIIDPVTLKRKSSLK